MDSSSNGQSRFASKETTVLQGNELVSDLKTNRTQMTGGRVKGSFLPK